MDVMDIYQEIKEIKITDYKRISLVQSSIDNLYYIKKELKYYDKEVYLQLQQCSCTNFPKILHVKEKERSLIVIEEYINAPTLESYIANYTIEENQAIVIIKQLCDCLEILHTLKYPIIHRDIKPENIFYDHGRVVLFDFDIARIYSQEKNKDTVVLGSIGYAAPEQFGFGQSDTRSDIYALGVLMNVLLTKKLPQEMLYSGKYQKVIVKATSVDRNNRYNSMTELKKALNNQYFVIPGINNETPKQKIISIIAYLLIIAITVQMKQPASSNMNPILYYFTGFLYMAGLEFILYNKQLNFLHTQTNILYRVIGIVATYTVYLFVVTFLSMIVDSML